MPPVAESPFAGERMPGAERITAPGRIRSIVRGLEIAREPLQVEVPDCDRRATSAILGMREHSGVLYLDELNTATGHRALMRHRRLRITARLHGTQLTFTTRLLAVRRHAGLAVYELQLPGLITRTQRRDDYRLRLAPALVVPITVPDLDGGSVKGEILDLSTTGLGAWLHTRKHPASGALLRDVRLVLPSDGPLHVDVEVRFVRHVENRQLLRIGARFIGLDPAQNRQLARFVAGQQRKRRRQEPR